MILDKLKIEFQGKMPEEKEEEIKGKIESLSSSVKATSINVIGDETMVLSDVVDLCNTISKNLSEEIAVSFGIDVEENFEQGHRKIEITFSDNENDLKTISTQE